MVLRPASAGSSQPALYAMVGRVKRQYSQQPHPPAAAEQMVDRILLADGLQTCGDPAHVDPGDRSVAGAEHNIRVRHHSVEEQIVSGAEARGADIVAEAAMQRAAVQHGLMIEEATLGCWMAARAMTSAAKPFPGTEYHLMDPRPSQPQQARQGVVAGEDVTTVHHQ